MGENIETLLVDRSEEQAPEMVQQLRDYFGIEHVLPADLPVGDVMVQLDNGLLITERKTLHDFASSISGSDSRLFSQVHRMTQTGLYLAVIITGLPIYGPNDMLIINGKESGWYGSSIRAAILSVQWAGVAVLTCAPGYYARTISEAIRLAKKRDHIAYQRARLGGRKMPVNFFPDEPDEVRRIEFLMGIPGIGEKLSRALLEWANAPNNGHLARPADALEWASVLTWIRKSSRPKGWGDGLSTRFREFMGLEEHERLAVVDSRNMDEVRQRLTAKEMEHVAES